MFGFISKKRLIEEAIRIYENEKSSEAHSHDDFMYRCGNENALNALFSRLGINLTTIIQNRRINRCQY